MRWLVLSLAVAAGAVFGEAADDLGIARAALRDGLWEVARAHAVPRESAESRLIVLESLAGEGKWDDVRKQLEEWKDQAGDGFDYYRAVVRGDTDAAVAILRKGGSPSGCTEAALYEADVLAKNGKRAEAEVLWREVAQTTNVSARVLAVVACNLMDVSLLRRAYEEVKPPALLRQVGLRLGMAQLRDPKTAEAGEKLIRSVVKDAPDADGAREAYLAIAEGKVAAGRWKEADVVYREAIEIWPDVTKRASVQEGRGWTRLKLGDPVEALAAFRRAAELADDDEARALATLKEGDVLSEMGKEEQAMECYRKVLAKYPATLVAQKLQPVVRIRELEAKGRDLYRSYRFQEAMATFESVAAADPARRPRMDFFGVLCLYGQGREDEALARARTLAGDCPDQNVRRQAMLWLAKFLYNRREWKESGRLFAAAADAQEVPAQAAEALLWSARAALADGDNSLAIQQTTRFAETYPELPLRSQAFLVQGEALVELGRFDEAALIFERVSASETAPSADRAKAKMLRADALYAMGADNPQRYAAALEAYQAIRFGGDLSSSAQVVVSFKIARTLEKMKRLDEALDQYYAKVVLAYRENRLAGERMTEEARAAFSRAAFLLADEFESRGRNRQALSVLGLVVESDVPAAAEAARRVNRISNKGRIL